MVFETGPLIGIVADLFAVKLLSYLILVMEHEVGETGALSEITILTGGYEMARTIELKDTDVSKRHLYIVTRNAHDAQKVETAILRYTSSYMLLQDTLRTIDSDFESFHWQGPNFDLFTQDINDMLAASALILPGEAPSRCFRGRTSWIES